MPDTHLLRSYLYAPATSERILAKVMGRGADAVIIDLEDSVAESRKREARESAVAFLAQIAAGRSADGGAAASSETQVHVRVNVGRHGFDGDDVTAVVGPGLDAIRIPKCEDARRIRLLDTILSNLERERGLPTGQVRIYPLLESAAGVHNAHQIAQAPRVARLCFGASDFLADIGARGPAHGPATLYARSRMVLASRVAGIASPVDSVHTGLGDLEGLRTGSEVARDLGFSGKSVIHPDQLPIVHEVFMPSQDEVAWAKRVVASFEMSKAAGQAALELDGEFIDPAVVNRARAVLRLAGEEA